MAASMSSSRSLSRLNKCRPMCRSPYMQTSKITPPKPEHSSVSTNSAIPPCLSQEHKMEPTTEGSCCYEALGSPIGFIRSCFKSKNGTPRQPSVCAFSRARLKVLKEVFPNPEHSIHGLAEFSHVWILFIFHKNGGNFTKAKVKPPRLDGAKVGVFSTRSPHRPNPIGLTLAKLDRIEGDTLHLSGVDIIDGTPVLDIKPYVPSYDNPDHIQENQTSHDNVQSKHSPVTEKLEDPPTQGLIHECGDDIANVHVSSNRSSGKFSGGDLGNSEVSSFTQNTQTELENESDRLVGTDDKKPLCTLNPSASGTEENKPTTLKSSNDFKESRIVKNTTREQRVASTDGGCSAGSKVGVADWIQHPPIKRLDVRFTENSKAELQAFSRGNTDLNYRLEFLNDMNEAEQAICKILEADPRSTYRRNNCLDRLYFFTVDTLHVTCWFGQEFVEVVRIQPVCFAEIP